MTKNHIIGIMTILLFVVVFKNMNLQEQAKKYEEEIGNSYGQLVYDTRDAVRPMIEVDIAEAIKTEYGKGLIHNFNLQLRNKARQFIFVGNDISKIGDLLDEISIIQEKALDKGSITEEERHVYSTKLTTLNLILMDFEHHLNSRIDLYESFTSIENPEIVKKMEQRLNNVD
ncbi:hypothetical protein [Bacillus sp. AK128]